MTEEELKNYALAEIEKILNRAARSLRNFPTLPFPNLALLEERSNRLINDELCYDRVPLGLECATLLSSLNHDQRMVYEIVMEAIHGDHGCLFFVYGYGGTGKTYIWRTLSSALRSKGEIVLTVASSGIAALLMPSGRTTHSRFGIPLAINEDSTCNIKQGSPLAELIGKAKLIIWDETPMVHKHCFEALERTFRDILRFHNNNSLNMTFSGKVVVFGGDFRQILPVIPSASRQEIVSASLNSSYLWRFCKVLKLSKNMRLLTGSSSTDNEELRSFLEWILNIGDGKLGRDNDAEISFEIPDDFLIKDVENSIGAIVDSAYPNLLKNGQNWKYLQERAALAPTRDVVNKVNEYILSGWPGEEVTYLSSDFICKVDFHSDGVEDIYTPEFLNTITSSGLPNHKLTLRVRILVMLLRNIDQTFGLCNGTQLVLTHLGKHVIGAE